ncbi:MAG: C-GCAxxG-C-C family protein [bacterium]
MMDSDNRINSDIPKVEEVALRYFDSNYNCAEAVALTFKHFMGDLDFLPRVATPFGAGIGRKGYICGALIGGLICIGCVFGREDSEGDRKTSYGLAGCLIDDFREAFGHIDCYVISKVDWNTDEGIRDYFNRVHYEVFHNVVRFVVGWLYKNDILKI